MVRAIDIVEFLTGTGDTDVRLPESHPVATVEILQVTTDLDAKRGHLSWISRRNLEREPDRLLRFGGTVLIAPSGVQFDPISSDRVILPCDDPKLAFVKAIDHFFAEQAKTVWPSAGAALSADAKIGRGTELSTGVVIGPRVTIGDGVEIGPNTCIANCTIASGVVVGANCSIGLPGFGYARGASGGLERFPHLGGVRIEEGVEIGSNTCIDRGSIGDTVIGKGAKIDNLVHIAHNVVIGRNVVVIANAMIGGSVQIDDDAWVAPSVSIRDQLVIGSQATLGLGAVVVKSVDDGAVMVGNPAKPLERPIS